MGNRRASFLPPAISRTRAYLTIYRGYLYNDTVELYGVGFEVVVESFAIAILVGGVPEPALKDRARRR